ncbi:MAG: hypothetical protein JWN48_5965 [Myxococcaceae bacterium]|nr:hypothetical protein [Myxococcaceae bacterium]
MTRAVMGLVGVCALAFGALFPAVSPSVCPDGDKKPGLASACPDGDKKPGLLEACPGGGGGDNKAPAPGPAPSIV